ncbi:MAG TPA: ribosomal protein S18-alanine N-acetyltransferase [Acidimicrobiales bacterium]|nr:ribosomal protein S18-alanine N-acetyltransferase [Acidimicrobiales bacterium]
MKSTWTIRLAERRDIGELLEIEEAQFPEPWTRRILLDEIGNTETRRYTVATEKRRILGYLGVMFVLDELHVNTIGTVPQEEGRGIATSLLDDAWADARERGITRATLEVAVSNQRAIDLYYRYGFRPVGVRKNYYEKSNEDALILWADLSSEMQELPPTVE